jgi:hypothetical protein
VYRTTVNPYRFNPKAETQADRYFVQILARFNPERDVFICKQELAEPTTEIPRYIKPVKAERKPLDSSDQKARSNNNRKPTTKPVILPNSQVLV